MEIERKYTVRSIPEDLSQYPCRRMEQAYLCTNPVVRVRKEDSEYHLTCKGSGMLVREETSVPISEEAYCHLREKADGRIISKKRYLIPLEPDFREGVPLTIELDVFDPPLAPLVMAEVEFPSLEAAEAFLPPDWFAEEVTYREEYHNSHMALGYADRDAGFFRQKGVHNE
ncbi:MAG: CYTH domain-containing protein [Clostridium sp.]|nr:CYTH domain-containing protein [Clostridium sp.]